MPSAAPAASAFAAAAAWAGVCWWRASSFIADGREGREDRAADADPERLGDREAEGLEGCRSRTSARRSAGDRREGPPWILVAEVARPDELVEVQAAGLGRLAEAWPSDVGDIPAAVDLRPASCSDDLRAKTVPTMARATEPPIWRKNVRLDVATPRSWNGTAFWTIEGEDGERRAHAEPGDEHPEPDDRDRRVGPELGHQGDRDGHQRDRADESATCSGRFGRRSGRRRSSSPIRPTMSGRAARPEFVGL